MVRSGKRHGIREASSIEGRLSCPVIPNRRCEVNGAPDAVAGRDHVIAEGAFLARTDAQDCGARAFV
jgi:hypothetical protein